MGHTSLMYLVPQEKLGIFLSGNNKVTDIKVEQFVVGFVTDLLLGLEPWLDVPSSCNFPCSFVDCTTRSKDEKEQPSPAEILLKGQELRNNLPPLETRREVLEEYAGIYFDPGYDTMRVTLIENGTLWFEFNEIKGPLISIAGQGRDVLFALPEYWYNTIVSILAVRFNRDPAGGHIVSATVSLESRMPPTFVRQ